MRRSVNNAHPGERPDAVHYFADDLFFRDTSDRGVPRIDRYRPVVSHDEDLALGYLVRKLDVRLAVGFLFQVRLFDFHVVDVNVAGIVDVHPVARVRDDPLDQDVVVVVEGFLSGK